MKPQGVEKKCLPVRFPLIKGDREGGNYAKKPILSPQTPFACPCAFKIDQGFALNFDPG
jgi:hypothetical protein